MVDVERTWPAPYPIDLAAVLGSFARGSRDPAFHTEPDGSIWRTQRGPDGPATLRLGVGGGVIRAAAWGPGSRWALDSVPSLLGFADDPTGFPEASLPEHLSAAWHRRGPGLRTPRSGLVLEALVAAVLEQKVTGVQSRRAWRHLLTEVGEPAPGPTPRPMRVFPAVDDLRGVPSWSWHAWGVEPSQSATVLRAAQVAGRLEECPGLSPDAARRRLGAVGGIGAWTAAEVAQRALGDPDAVSFGDYHLAQAVVFAFTARPSREGGWDGDRQGSDERMAELLEPFAGHRYRVQRLVELSGIERPSRGPRMAIADHRRR